MTPTGASASPVYVFKIMSVGCNGICCKSLSYFSFEISDTAAPLSSSSSTLQFLELIKCVRVALFWLPYTVTFPSLYSNHHFVFLQHPNDAHVFYHFTSFTWLTLFLVLSFSLKVYFISEHASDVAFLSTRMAGLIFVPAVLIRVVRFPTSLTIASLFWWGNRHCIYIEGSAELLSFASDGLRGHHDLYSFEKSKCHLCEKSLLYGFVV